MKIFLHIGVDKCGSTAIQSGLWRNREKLGKAGIAVPNLGFSEIHGHGRLFQAVLGLVDPCKLDAPLRDARNVAQQLSSELRDHQRTGADTAVLTWEGLNFLSGKKVTELSRLLYGHSVTLVVYVREQAAIIQSGVLQNIKDPYHGCQSLDSIRGNMKFLPANRDYFSLVRLWKKQLNPDNVVVRGYERQSLLNGDAFADFVSVITDDEPQGLDSTSVDRNTSIDVPSALVLDAVSPHIGRGSKMYYQLVNILLEEIEHKGKSLQYFLNKRQVDHIESYYRRSNSKLASTFLNYNTPLFISRSAPVCSREDYSKAMSEAAAKLRSVVHLHKNISIDSTKLAFELESTAKHISPKIV